MTVTILFLGSLETVFHHNSKYVEVRQIHSTARRILNTLLKLINNSSRLNKGNHDCVDV